VAARGTVPFARVVWVLVAFAVYALARVWISHEVPWRRAFDDGFFIPETIRWLRGGHLGEDATFARVPLWHLLLGAHYTVFRTHALPVLQGWIVLASIAVYAAWVGPRATRVRWLPLLVFVLSPQILLYSRQSVNELWIGLLTMGVMLLGDRGGARAALPMGVLVGLAACTKPAAGLTGLVALGYALRDPSPRAPALARLAAGTALVALPLLGYAVWLRGDLLVDNTTAFNLSGMTVEAWRALPDAAARQAEGMARFREVFAAEPLGYLVAAGGRAVDWLVRPSSLDFGRFYQGYPIAWVGAADAAAFAILGLLALVGTTRRNAVVWLLVAGWTAACAFPLFTPRSPKVVLLFPLLLLAERGVARIEERIAARRPDTMHSIPEEELA
jgi:hypothetical protein